MNVDVCGKCPYIFTLKQNAIGEFCVKCFDERSGYYVLIEEIDDEFFKYAHDFYWGVMSKEEFYSKMKPLERCPYYMEHQLNDWNKKNDK